MLEENEYSPFGPYVLLKRIAKGDLTEFYLAVPADTERTYERLVIKRLLPEYAGSPDHVAYFLREAKLTAQLVHPNISRVVEVGRHEGQTFMALEHLDGRDLDLLIRLRRSMLKPPVAAYICGRVCAALDYLHGATGVSGSRFGVVHGNLTPENILVGGAGEVKLIDFGSARVSPEPVVVPKGAPRSKLPPLPPQLEGAELDGRADLFALGAALYEATTGAKVDHDPAPPSQLVPNYPPELARIVMRALARDPAGCYASAAEMQDALEQFLRPFGKDQTELPMASLVEAKPFGSRPPGQPQRRPGAKVDGDDIADERVETKIKALSEITPPRKPLRPQGVNVDEEALDETGLLPSLVPADDGAEADEEERTALLPSLSLPEADPGQQADDHSETGLLPALVAEPPSAAPAPRADTFEGREARVAQPRPVVSADALGDGSHPQDWDAITASHEDAADLVAQAMAQQPAPVAGNRPETPPPAKHARLFGAFLKGAALAALILASAFIARVGTIAEIRQQLAATGGPGPGEPAVAVAGDDQANPAEPVLEAAGEPVVAAVAVDAGPTDEIAVAAEPASDAADAGQPAVAQAVPVEAAREVADPVEAVKKAEASPARTGFGVIVVKGRGKLFIDGKPCRAPCAVKVPAGEHEVSSKGSRPFKRKLIVEAGAKEVVTVR